MKKEPQEINDDGSHEEKPDAVKEEKVEVKKEAAEVKPDPAVLAAAAAKLKEQKLAEAEVLRDLKAQLK